jgi:hypothetical protein
MYYVGALYNGSINDSFLSDTMEFRQALSLMVEMFETKLAENKPGLLVIELIDVKDNRIVGRMFV